MKIMDWEKFVSFVEKYEPGYSKKIKGSSDESISNFQKYCPKKFPVNYINFLKTMGDDIGGLPIFQNLLLKPDDILEYAESKSIPVFIENRYFCFAIWPDEAPGLSLDMRSDECLDFEQGDEIDTFISDYNRLDMEADDDFHTTLAEHLQNRVFEEYVYKNSLNQSALIVSCSNDDNFTIKYEDQLKKCKKICDVMIRLGIESVLSGSEHQWYGIGMNNICVKVEIFYDDNFISLDIGGDDEKEVHKIMEIMEDNFSARISQVRY